MSIRRRVWDVKFPQNFSKLLRALQGNKNELQGLFVFHTTLEIEFLWLMQWDVLSPVVLPVREQDTLSGCATLPTPSY